MIKPSADESAAINSIAPVKTPSVHLKYLDGLRGLAALYVVIHHAYLEACSDKSIQSISPAMAHATNWLKFGQIAVDIFIVLSGYCLMIPVAKNENGSLRGGFKQFMLRRARRLLPPYYAALFICLAVIAVVPVLKHPSGLFWDVSMPAFTASAIGSHLLMIQNLNSHWVHAIDYPMWSVATEWQIYFLFPLLLLPVWKKYGLSALVIGAFIIGLMPYFILKKGDGVCPWFIGLFALGMAAANKNFSSTYKLKQNFVDWNKIGLLLILIFWCGTEFAGNWLLKHYYVMDTFVGVITAILIMNCTSHLTQLETVRRPVVLNLLENKWVVQLGVFSYSLYLIHAPILALLHAFIREFQLNFAAGLSVMIGLGAPMCIVLAYIFHILFERRFMTKAA